MELIAQRHDPEQCGDVANFHLVILVCYTMGLTCRKSHRAMKEGGGEGRRRSKYVKGNAIEHAGRISLQATFHPQVQGKFITLLWLNGQQLKGFRFAKLTSLQEKYK